MSKFAKRPHSGRKDKRAGVYRKEDLRSERVFLAGKSPFLAKKSLGQHFLNSKSALDKIISAGEVSADDIVIEIGPGKGALTEELLKYAGKVVAIEKDGELVAELTQKFSHAIDGFRLELAEGDILGWDIEKTVFKKKALKYKVIANIPYYITNAIIRLFLESDTQPERMVILIQKEVAERIIAKNTAVTGSKSGTEGKESLLSIAAKAYGTPKIIAKVSAGSFTPPPKVDSAILLIKDISKKNFTGIDEKTFFKIVRAGFAHKRKKLSGNLTLLYNKDKINAVFTKLKMSLDTRAEDININDWKKLAKELTK